MNSQNKESERLKALEDFKILDTSDEAELNDIVNLASRICEAPISLISLVDRDRQWFKARIGLGTKETPRDIAFCSHAIEGSSTMIIEDALLDKRFSENPLVTGEPFIRFYAGALLQTSSGLNVGTLCVVDRKSRTLSANQIEALEILSRQVIVNFERRKLKLESIAREKFLKKVLGALPTVVAYLDHKFCFQYVNAAFLKLFNLDESQQQNGLTAKTVLGDGYYSKLNSYVESALRGTVQKFEMCFETEVNTQKKKKAFQFQFIPDLGYDGKIEGIFAMATDVTKFREIQDCAVEQGIQLKIALKQSQVSEKYFRTLIDNTPMGIVQLDSELRILSTNIAFRKFLGYEEGELENRSILEITHPEEIQSSLETIDRIKDPVFSLKRFERRYIHKSGKIVWALLNSRSVQFTENGDYSVFSILEDITEFRKTEEELRIAQSNLLMSSKMALLGEMASGVAHEINNPLAILLGKIGIIKKQNRDNLINPEQLERNLDILEKATLRISKIVKGLRIFSRSSKDDAKVDFQIAGLIKDTFELCRDRFKISSCEFRFEALESLLVPCRPSEISQVLLNLLNNAFDAVQSLNEKWISVVIERKEDFVLIKVIDSGLGIPNEVVEKMMNPFFTTKEVGLGTGLGLSISKGIAVAHGGHLTYSLENGHTCFVLSLPVEKNSINASVKKVS